MGFSPTEEQLRALELFETGGSLAIEAGAGTGKTSTLVQLAESTNRRGQYIAFNKAIVSEAGSKFPATVNCSTAHSLAWQAIVGPDLKRRIQAARRMKPLEIAAILGIDAMMVTTYTGEMQRLGAGYLAGLTMRTVGRFCQSADPAPTVRHMPKVDGLDAPLHTQHGLSKYPVNDSVAKAIHPFVMKAWKDLCRPDGALSFDHGHYLKLWHLSGPKIDADYILFDEAQDANPVLQAIVAAQAHAQIVWVGDSQQSIYGFTGAINALAQVEIDHKTFLTQSFRFGPAVAEVANRVLDRLDAELRIIGTPAINSVVEEISDPDVLLTRTNAGAVRAMLDAQAEGKKVHLVGGSAMIASFARAAKELMEGRPVDHPELACFGSWDEVLDYVEEDEDGGGDLRVLVKLIEDFDIDKILAAVTTTSQERHADLVISTAHKSKGREWDAVKLGNDFPSGEKAKDEELRLLYVAATRAKKRLDISLVATLSEDAPIPDHEKPLKRGPRKSFHVSEYIGTVDGKIDLTLTVERVREFDGKYGVGYVVSMRDDPGNSFVWITSKEVSEGDVLTATWTITEHDQYNGVRQTKLTRPAGMTVVGKAA